MSDATHTPLENPLDQYAGMDPRTAAGLAACDAYLKSARAHLADAERVAAQRALWEREQRRRRPIFLEIF